MKLNLLLFFNLILAVVFAQHSTETAYVPGEMMVQFKKASGAEQVARDLIVKYPEYEIRLAKELSKPMGIWMFTFNEEKVSHQKMIDVFSKYEVVIAAQNNHYIQERASTLPDDPQIGSQWHHVNDGSGGGIADADVDSDLAWDITTGGTTEFGDEIVVCIVEGGGADLTHPDLIDNHWYNVHEIPDNGIDDDGNGYVDDYAGWDVSSGTDNFPAGGHGTNCAGMVGAKGNNGIGVVGMNWDVKIMMVSGFSASESDVITAYAYPLEMRKRYNASNGEEGAFVVVTSASWGIDGGNPANSPLWCNYYDTLGVHGILNMGATSNSNVNIDQVGDLPTACTSDYMVAVTATNKSDVRTFSGYGVEHIDIAAPGEDVFMTSSNGGYGASSGTSFATPLTAGAVGLMYSIPCASFIAMVKSDPQMAADMVRQALYDGLDPVDNLDGETKYGGRLNVYNAIQILMDQCDTTGCLGAYSVNASAVTDTEATISWSTIDSSNDVLFGISVEGEDDWSTTTVSNDTVMLDTLTACTFYDVFLVSNCDTSSSDTTFFNFKTDGCCEAPSTVSVEINNAINASVTWSNVLAATSYNLQYQLVGSNDWQEVIGVTSPYEITNLDSCANYEVQIQTVCAGGPVAYGESTEFSTLGCGVCAEGGYCESKGDDASYEWIDNVVIGELSNNSGENDGYILFDDPSATLYTLNTTNVTLTPGFSGSTYDEYWKIWIDMDHNGVFDDTELLFSNDLTDLEVTGSFVIPATSELGVTRMRVSMRYDNEQTACETFNYGEVEDYCVNIQLGSSVNEAAINNFMIFPNPASDIMYIRFNQAVQSDIEIVNMLGQKVYETTSNESLTELDVTLLEAGTYYITVRSNDSVQTQKMVIK